MMRWLIFLKKFRLLLTSTKLTLTLYLEGKLGEHVMLMQLQLCFTWLCNAFIVGREGGVPDFYAIRKRIINEYGEPGADTETVLMNVCSEYRLRFCEVDETGARKAINRRRPVVATFWLYDQEWAKFKQVFKKTRKGILKKSDLYTGMKNCIYTFLHACMHALCIVYFLKNC